MPRPKRERKCQCPFNNMAFKPTGIPMDQLECIDIFQDELEAFRLCDAEGLTQEEAGVQMTVSRGTVQRLLASARYKIAKAISQGKALVIQGQGTQEKTHEDHLFLNADAQN